MSTKFERPTVSIQNGLPICRVNSSDRVVSSRSKNGLERTGGSSSPGAKLMRRPRFCSASRDSVSVFASDGLV